MGEHRRNFIITIFSLFF